jgi:hypothetical protein
MLSMSSGHMHRSTICNPSAEDVAAVNAGNYIYVCICKHRRIKLYISILIYIYIYTYIYRYIYVSILICIRYDCYGYHINIYKH